MAAQIFPFLFPPFKSRPLARGILLGEKKVEIAILYTYMYISACRLVWLSFVNISLSLWSSDTPAGSGLSLTHVSFTQSLELYVTNVFRIKPLKEKLLHLRWHKQDKHTKSKLREIYFFLPNIRNILAPVLEHQASTVEESPCATELTKRSVRDSCMMINPLIIRVRQSFAPILKRLSKAPHRWSLKVHIAFLQEFMLTVS